LTLRVETNQTFLIKGYVRGIGKTWGPFSITNGASVKIDTTLAKLLTGQEMEQEIDDYLNKNPIKEPLPFEPLHETLYTIGEIAVAKTQANSLKLDFPISIDEDIEGTHRLTLYFKALDQEGNDIEDSKSVAGGMGRPSLKAGSTFVVSGYWQNKTLRNMADFAKIVEISREEYNKK